MPKTCHYPRIISLRTTAAEWHKLSAVAHATGRTVSDVLRVLIAHADVSLVEVQTPAFGERFGAAARARRAAAKR